MKKVLVLATTPFLNDGLTKIEMDVYQYCSNQMQFAFATSFTENNKFHKQLRKDGTPIYSLKKKKRVLAYMESIRKLIYENDFDVVYIHGNSAMMLIEALPCKISGAKKIVTHCHNTKTKYGLFHYLFKPLFNCIVDEKLACSELAARWAYTGQDYHVILNGIDTKKFRFRSDIRESVREELGWEDKFVIGHIGRFSFQKNHEFLIRVFAEVYRKSSDARLLLIGEGELENRIRQQVRSMGLQNVVCFLGVTDKVQDYIQAMDVFVLPSLFEGLGIVAVEAQNNGLPVLLADTIPEEAFVSKNAVSLSLKQPHKIWAKAILDMKGIKRTDCTTTITERNMDFQSMMEQIRLVLSKE